LATQPATGNGPRLGARVLLVDADDRLLLLRAHDPAKPDRSVDFAIFDPDSFSAEVRRRFDIAA